jgi:hypothetical protein
MEETPATLPPEPEETGVQPDQRPPTQEQSQTLVQAVSGTGLAAFQLSDTLQEIREVRGQTGMLLLHGHAKRQEREAEQLRLERNEALKELDRYRTLYHDEKEKSSILRAQRDAARTLNRFRQIFITLGGIVTGIGVPGLITTPNADWGLPATLLGVVLLGLGWFVRGRRGEGNE